MRAKSILDRYGAAAGVCNTPACILFDSHQFEHAPGLVTKLLRHKKTAQNVRACLALAQPNAILKSVQRVTSETKVLHHRH